MSGQHWVDAFFRKRMEHRKFPVEAGEFEEMRALLDKRNSTVAGAVRGGFSKWWFSALIPVAGLLWWASGGVGSDMRVDVRPTVEEVVSITGSVDQHVAPASGSNVDQGGLSSSGSGTDGNTDHAASAVALRQAVSEASGTPATAMVEGERSATAVGATVRNAHTPTVVADDRLTALAAHQSGVLAHTSPATSSDRNVQGADPIGTGRTNVNEVKESAQQDAGTFSEKTATLSAADESREETSMAGMEHRSVRDVGMIELLELRMPTPSMTTVPEPVRCELPVFDHIPMGALHVFGAPLAVRARSSTGERSSTEAGSLFGLEYRIRSKRFVWATGVHYGSYALKADEGATDVKLNFVEVPVLASYQLSRGRFGFAMQGGLSVDLLFNARGRYPVEGDRSGAAFPDHAFRTTNISWSLRPQVSYHVNEYLSVNAGPLWKAQMSDVAKTGPLDDARISSSGVTIGITWRLDHSTF